METFVGKVAEHSKVFSSLTTFEFLIYDLRAFLHTRRGNRAAAKRELEVQGYLAHKKQRPRRTLP